MSNLSQKNIVLLVGLRRCGLSGCFEELLSHLWILIHVTDELKPIPEAMLGEDEAVECLDPLVELAK